MLTVLYNDLCVHLAQMLALRSIASEPLLEARTLFSRRMEERRGVLRQRRQPGGEIAEHAASARKLYSRPKIK